MPRVVQRITRLLPIVAAGLVFATVASAQSQDVVFQGLTHAAVGRAALRIDEARDALLVNTFNPAGEDGVIVDLPDAASWFARLESTSATSSPMTMAWHALADARRISTASMRQAGSQFALTALFTGSTQPTYAAHVYNDGKLVGALGGLPPTAAILVPSSVCDIPEFAVFFNCRLTLRFHNTYNGECIWEFVWDGAIPVRLPNGTVVTGNELRLVEEVRPGSHYPYVSFDAMVVQTNADLALLAEGVR